MEIEGGLMKRLKGGKRWCGMCMNFVIAWMGVLSLEGSEMGRLRRGMHSNIVLCLPWKWTAWDLIGFEVVM